MVIEQDIYARLLNDSHLTCTCDESVRDLFFMQAKGHYHSCMLYQVARTIEITMKALNMVSRKPTTKVMGFLATCTGEVK